MSSLVLTLEAQSPLAVPDGEAEAADGVLAAFRARLDALPEPERPFLTAMYANPIRNRAATR